MNQVEMETWLREGRLSSGATTVVRSSAVDIGHATQNSPERRCSSGVNRCTGNGECRCLCCFGFRGLSGRECWCRHRSPHEPPKRRPAANSGHRANV